eukprot:3142897-Rhodomonas_salina.2
MSVLHASKPSETEVEPLFQFAGVFIVDVEQAPGGASILSVPELRYTQGGDEGAYRLSSMLLRSPLDVEGVPAAKSAGLQATQQVRKRRTSAGDSAACKRAARETGSLPIGVQRREELSALVEGNTCSWDDVPAFARGLLFDAGRASSLNDKMPSLFDYLPRAIAPGQINNDSIKCAKVERPLMCVCRFIASTASTQPHSENGCNVSTLLLLVCMSMPYAKNTRAHICMSTADQTRQTHMHTTRQQAFVHVGSQCHYKCNIQHTQHTVQPDSKVSDRSDVFTRM